MYDESDYSHQPKILLFDIETTPFVAYSWGPKYQVNLIDFIHDWHVLCFAYKWLGEDDVKIVSQRQFPSYHKHKNNRRKAEETRRDDKSVVKEMWRLFDEADIIIAHNGDKFDIKKMNARFAIHGLGRPTPFHTVDTVKVARRSFSFGSNSLNDLGKFLSLGQKLTHTGFELWVGCMAGLDEDWQLMEDYNKQDVVLLEQVYKRFLMEGWIDNHPSLSLISGQSHGCPNCLSVDRQKRGFHNTKAYRFQRYQCNNCKSYYRGRSAQEGSRSAFR